MEERAREDLKTNNHTKERKTPKSFRGVTPPFGLL